MERRRVTVEQSKSGKTRPGVEVGLKARGKRQGRRPSSGQMEQEMTQHEGEGSTSSYLTEPPDADPHVRWCGRGAARPSPYPDSCAGGSAVRAAREMKTLRDRWLLACQMRENGYNKAESTTGG